MQVPFSLYVKDGTYDFTVLINFACLNDIEKYKKECKVTSRELCQVHLL